MAPKRFCGHTKRESLSFARQVDRIFDTKSVRSVTTGPNCVAFWPSEDLPARTATRSPGLIRISTPPPSCDPLVQQPSLPVLPSQVANSMVQAQTPIQMLTHQRPKLCQAGAELQGFDLQHPPPVPHRVDHTRDPNLLMREVSVQIDPVSRSRRRYRFGRLRREAPIGKPDSILPREPVYLLQGSNPPSRSSCGNRLCHVPNIRAHGPAAGASALRSTRCPTVPKPLPLGSETSGLGSLSRLVSVSCQESRYYSIERTGSVLICAVTVRAWRGRRPRQG